MPSHVNLCVFREESGPGGVEERYYKKTMDPWWHDIINIYSPLKNVAKEIKILKFEFIP